MARNDYNPDVLNCLANLSSDEIFTPPQLANRMLDLLPQELFANPATRFLDPCCKSGVFLREIVKRLDRGLQPVIADRRERIEHIVQRQVFGIAITELTALMSRRSVYCSKYADSPYSVHQFGTREGNIQYQPLHHTWQGGKCVYCGASQGVYDRGEAAEQHAYQFIHTNNPEKIFNMKFDVIIGNPPYQLSKATENSTNNNSAFASAIYPYFIEQAIKLHPRYLIMITPSRWMTKTGQGISDEWVDKMITGNHFVEIHDYIDSTECFSGVDIMGGVSYFLYQPSYNGKCKFVCHRNEKETVYSDYINAFGTGIIIRDPQAMTIIHKVSKIEGNYYKEKSFSDIVSPLHFYDRAGQLSSNWTGYVNAKDGEHPIKLYINKRLANSGFGWVRLEDIPKNQDTVQLHKVYIPEANGSIGENSTVLGVPFYGEPGSVCSQTYLVIGYNKKYNKKEYDSIISYIKTRFFRYMVSIKKNTQHAPYSVYQFVPMQDFSHPWTDEMLYEKYGLTEEEIAFIESMVRPMD